jgi:hypothetical protein
MEGYDFALTLNSSLRGLAQIRIVNGIGNTTACPALASYHFHTQMITEDSCCAVKATEGT